MKKTVAGILAHVDAGKTTLSEALLYLSGVTGTLGRVDYGNAFLDNFEMERTRGITIFSKQAVIFRDDIQITLLDTPGHVDLSPETERVLDVLDFGILVVSGPEGVQSHTRTLWKLLCQRNIPVFVFINKMDLAGADRNYSIENLNKSLDGYFFDYRNPDVEALAMCNEEMMEEYLSDGELKQKSVIKAIQRCEAFPCWFGAALKLEGVEEFLSDLTGSIPEKEESEKFGAKVYKISRDEKGNRLTHMKITGGRLDIRGLVGEKGKEEKITQIRNYTGEKFRNLSTAEAGDVVAVTGLSHTLPGMGLGIEEQGRKPELTPVLTYSVILPEGQDVQKAYSQLKLIEEEEPELNLSWNERQKCLQLQLMGPVQLEIIKHILYDRFSLDVEFGPGQLLYRETILNTVEGVGHYEPLKHYAEVHLVIEPGKPGSGVVIKTECPEDSLDRNWQRLIMTHISEKMHIGVLTGSPITDIVISLTAGKAHPKHTEGGDFRQAVYRAIRNGLMQAESILLEPWYEFRMEIPKANIGRTLTDLDTMGAKVSAPELSEEYAVITGRGPVSSLGEYSQTFTSYTHGLGNFFCTLSGYSPCMNQEKIIEEIGYNPEADRENTADSIFCSHGAGFNVNWKDVKKYMHLQSTLEDDLEKADDSMDNSVDDRTMRKSAARYIEAAISDEELMEIFERTYGPIKKDRINKIRPLKKSGGDNLNYSYKNLKKAKTGPEYLLVDGYNIIFSWKRLKALAEVNIDSARDALIDALRNYQGFKQTPVIVVFDAYKVKGNPGSIERYGGLTVVFTKEAEIADTYIERAAYKLSHDRHVRVATSDRLEQMIILGNGALRISAQAFEKEVENVEGSIRELLEEIRMEENLNNTGNRAVIK